MKIKDWLLATILGGIAAVVYFLTKAPYAYPGESAHLQALWRGLDFSTETPYPLMAVFAKLFGCGNAIAPVCGVLAVVLAYFLVSGFVRSRVNGETTIVQAGTVGRVAGVTAAIVFMFTPAVRAAATHLEPRLFDAVWAMLIFALFVPYAKAPVWLKPLFLLVMGVMTALGFCDTPLFVAIAPFILFALVSVELRREVRPYLAITIFAVAFLIAFFVALSVFDIELTELLKTSAKGLKTYYGISGWLFIAAFATLPFVVSIFSSTRAFNDETNLTEWLFHGAMSIIAILAVATPLSPSSLMTEHGILPVVSSFFVAAVAGYLISFWWVYRSRPMAVAIGVVLAFVLSFSSLWNLFAFDGNRGAFADEVAAKIIKDLGQRKWLVTDGTLDDHLRILSANEGRELNLISLQRDLDTDYLERLGDLVRAKRIGGAKNEEMTLSLTLGVLPFVQDWFAADPNIADEVAIFGAPDIWYSANLKPVPEFFFFGANPKIEPDPNAWKQFDEILAAPKGWGSYRMDLVKDPLDLLRLALRRHLGMVCNNRGVYLQDQKRDDEAFACYERVLNEIDSDNVCSIFNEVQMAGAKYPKALEKKRDLQQRIKTIVDDKNRRYVIWRLGYFYGYIRDPDMFVRLGFAWARSGRPGDALSQIRRAIDFVPSDKRSIFLNMMAALYANENDQNKSRRIYESVLAKNAHDHDALIGMMRLELLNGGSKKAMDYLQKAAAASPSEGKQAKIELAMVALMKNDLTEAKKKIQSVIDTEPKDMQAWSLLAAITMQQYDNAKDDATKKKLKKELSEQILPTMEKNANPYDYYVQITKAFLLLHDGKENRRAARDAFAAAARARPDSTAAQDLVLGLDISLDDRASAERHAREVLRRNRNAPLANYVMGSLAIRRGQYREAEAFLRKSALAPQPNVLALNDLAEVLRRTGKLTEAERFAKQAVEKAPNLYVAWETLGVVQMDLNLNLDEAEKNIRKAIEISTKENSQEEDVRIYTSLARVQILKGDKKGARSSLRKVQKKLDTLTDFERREFEEVQKSAN